MTATGIDPAVIGTEVRVGRFGRENRQTKATRLLVEGRVSVRYVDVERVRAHVRGDSGEYRVEEERGLWSCTCAARGACAHLEAVLRVVPRPSTAVISRDPQC